MQNFKKLFIVACLALSTNVVRADDDSDSEVDSITHDEGEAIIQRCLKDDAQACYDYAFYAAKKLDNYSTYRLALKRACRRHHLDACEQIEKDDKEGDGYRKKCDAGDVDSCVIYSSGRALMYEDLIGAIHYASKACRLGHEASCKKIKIEQDKITDGKIKTENQ